MQPLWVVHNVPSGQPDVGRSLRMDALNVEVVAHKHAVTEKHPSQSDVHLYRMNGNFTLGNIFF